MTVRAVEGKLPYTGGKAITVDENKVISLNLRDENNLIIYDEGDNEIYVDLQLPAGIRPNYAFPVGITTGRVLVADDWDVTGTIIVAKTTSGDVIKLLYGDDGTLWMDNGTGLFKQIYFKADVDLIITNLTNYINTELAKKQDKLIAGENISIVDNVISSTPPTRARFLSIWDSSTGEPISFPARTPFTYASGDYYLVENVDATTNYRPDGNTYTGTASTTVETEEVLDGDVYIYDGSVWLLQSNTQKTVAFANIAGQPTDNTNLATALGAKQDTLVSGTNIKTINNTSLLGSGDITISAPTYTAGDHIDITNNVISTEGLQDELTAGDNITIVSITESDMKGPCDSGFHVPLIEEWNSLKSVFSTLNLTSVANYQTYLKMPLAGKRSAYQGSESEAGTKGYYWSATSLFDYSAYIFNLSNLTTNSGYGRTSVFSIRPFKNTPVVPDNSWTTLYDGSSTATDAGIFHNTTEGLISISADGTTRITIADKNIGASTVWNYGDTETAANCGNYFQRGNNYPFPGLNGRAYSTRSGTKVSAAGYGPGNYFSSSTMIYGDNAWDSSGNNNLRGCITHGTYVVSTTINAVIPDTANTKTFYLTGNSDLTNAQAAVDYYFDGGNPIIVYANSIPGVYTLQSKGNSQLVFVMLSEGDTNYTGYTTHRVSYILTINFDSSTKIVSSYTNTQSGINYLKLDTNYSSPYLPTYDGSPATKKYVDNVAETKQDNLTAGDNITIVQVIESDMKGPCESGFHLPLMSEWESLKTTLAGYSFTGADYKTYLHMPYSGQRHRNGGTISYQDERGFYWTTVCNGSNSKYFQVHTLSTNTETGRGMAYSLRAFKNTPVIPDSSDTNWVQEYEGTSGAGVWHNATEGIISISSDATNWITIADKNVGATTVYNSGDTLTEANAGKYYQWGNCYGFPWTGTLANTSSTKVNTTGYGPGNFFSSDTFILQSEWLNPVNTNLWGGVTHGTYLVSTTINAVVPDTSNTKTFYLSSLNDLTNAQAAYDWYLAGKNPIIVYNNDTYLFYNDNQTDSIDFRNVKTGSNAQPSYTQVGVYFLSFTYSNTTVTVITPTTLYSGNIAFLSPDTNYATPYTPQYAGSPATKKYVDDSIAVGISSQANNILTSGMKIRAGTEANYNNLGTYDSNTLYLTIE